MFVCFDGQTVYLSIMKIFHNLIIKDLRHFLALFVGQKSQLIIHNIKNKICCVRKRTQQSNKERPKDKIKTTTLSYRPCPFSAVFRRQPMISAGRGAWNPLPQASSLPDPSS